MTEPSDRIDILLAVYNGAAYLEAAIASVEAQSHKNWTLIVRDDGSSDATPEILQAWQQRLGERMTILPNPERRNLGMNGNYTALLAASTAPYVTHLSHDDLYHPDRLALTLRAMRDREALCSPGRPVLVYSDQRVIDAAGGLVSASMWGLTGWHPPEPPELGPLLVHTAVYGGTILANRPLTDLINPLPARSRQLNDDTRFGWLAAVFGEMVPLTGAMVDFRRHGTNQSGLISLRSTLGLLKLPLKARGILHERLKRLHPEVRAFLDEYGSRLPPPAREAAEAFLALQTMSPLARRRAILRHRLLYASNLRNIGLLVLI